jgi:hypothetical protein
MYAFTKYTNLKSIVDYHSTVCNDRESSLLRLPAELRNAVYVYVLYEGTYNFKTRDYCYAKHESILMTISYVRPGLGLERRPHRLSLLRVCRRIHQESSLLPLLLNTCVFERFEWLYKYHHTFTGAQLAAIRRICISFDLESPSTWSSTLSGLHGWGLYSLRAILPRVLNVELHFVNLQSILKDNVITARVNLDILDVKRWAEEVNEVEVFSVFGKVDIRALTSSKISSIQGDHTLPFPEHPRFNLVPHEDLNLQ